MAKKKTHVLFVLDSSGSMSSCKKAAIDHFNEQRATLQENPDEMGETDVSLILFGAPVEEGDEGPGFGTLVKRLFWRQSVEGLKELTEDNYHPSGNTPMYDAIGYAVTEAKNIDDGGEDTAVLIVVITDGAENASREWKDGKKLKEEIDALEKNGRWTFLFMGANIKWQDAAKIGLGGSYMAYAADASGIRHMSSGMSKGLRSYKAARSRGVTKMDIKAASEDDENEESENS